MAATLRVSKRSKYGAKRCHGFASKREYKRWCELQTLEKAGAIRCLHRQTRFWLHSGNGILICEYASDFDYWEGEQRVVEDCKGVRTAMYKLKRKWLKAEYGITIRET